MNKAPTMSSFRTRPKDTRPSAHKRGYGARWRNTNKTGVADIYLKKNPLCVDCKKEGFIVSNKTMVVDHKIPHKGDMRLFWDQSNWQTLCVPHHNKKTAREDGGFGNKVN